METGLGCKGTWAELNWAVREKIEMLCNFFSVVLNLNSKFKFKPNTFLNSDKFKYFTKKQI
jgi:hypothetical protein